MNETAEIISIGSELLLPEGRETNSSEIIPRLLSLGVEVKCRSIVGDDRKEIASAVREALRRTRWVILTGGLGPTEDDVTREAVAEALKRPLVLNLRILKQLQVKFSGRGRRFLKIHERQAWFPEKAVLISNETGIAPGFILKEKAAFLISLPGVPSEMRRMMEEAASFISGRIRRKNTVLFKKYKTFGISESEVNEAIRELFSDEEMTVGLLAKGTGVEIFLVSRGKTASGARSRLLKTGREIKKRFNALIYGEDQETLEAVVGGLLKKRGMTLSVAESCTGGLASHRLTNISGSSAYFNGSVVSYSNEMKSRILGVPKGLIRKFGAVSSQVVSAMAEGVRIAGKSDLGLAITGIAGPGGGSAEKPVGLVYFGLADGKKEAWEEGRYFVDRAAFKLFASSRALDMVRRHLLAQKR